MKNKIARVVVLGGGSAGYLSALAFRRFLDVNVALVQSPSIPVIGVGESTTAYFPSFLHNELGLDRRQFYADVQPSWKAGVRFEWGLPGEHHFNYSFDFMMNPSGKGLRLPPGYHCLQSLQDAAHFSSIMDRGLSPLAISNGYYHFQDGTGYHLDNKKFIAYLDRKASELGVEMIHGEVVQAVQRDDGDVDHLLFADGRQVGGDLFIDCSGFVSFLLGKTLGEPYQSFGNTLFCDRAVIGSWQRTNAVLPYTLAETYDHGWCWQIEFLDHITRGYVYSSQFCDEETARAELLAKNPQIEGQPRLVKFRSGRYQNYWRNNVAAIGNASGFVEPLEATALHLIAQQLVGLCQMLRDCGMVVDPSARDLSNNLFRCIWDEVRDFLALHYKFNRRRETPFWQHCWEHTDLGGAQPLVELYHRIGPAFALEAMVPKQSMFEYNGYMILLVGQRVPTDHQVELTELDRKQWRAWQQQVRGDIATALPLAEAMQIVNAPTWSWPTVGV